MTARRGWIFDNPPPPPKWPEPESWWGIRPGGFTSPYLHGRCPECGYATRWKQFGPMPCACPPEAIAARKAQTIPVTNPAHLIPSTPPSGPPLQIADRYAAGRLHR